MQEQEETTNSAIDQWQEACVSAEERCIALEKELDCLKQSQPSPIADSAKDDEVSHGTLTKSFDQKERDLEAALQAIESKDSIIRDLKGMYETECVRTKKFAHILTAVNPNPGQIQVLQQSLELKNAETAVVVMELTDKLRIAEERVQNIQNDFDNTMLSKKNEKEEAEGMGHLLMFLLFKTAR